MRGEKHAVITGTGRAGTTFLVELLTRLGLETGFSVDDMESKKSEVARAGLEYDIRKDDSPYIIKDPAFCSYVDEILCRDDIVIEHVFIPIRDLYEAAESRRYVENARISKWPLKKRLKNKIKIKLNLNLPVIAGGLWDTNSNKSGDQEDILLRKIYRLVLALSEKKVPITFIRYPNLVKDSTYLFEKLEPILHDITYESFSSAFYKTVRPELVHSFRKQNSDSVFRSSEWYSFRDTY